MAPARNTSLAMAPTRNTSLAMAPTRNASLADRLVELSMEEVVLIFTKSQCPMSHAVTRLFSDCGVSPVVHELDKDPQGQEMERELARLLGRSPSVPAVFIGGNLIGSTNRVMSLHLAGKLVPMLRAAGAI